MSKIGIPRTLAYFVYYPYWKIFFEELGHEPVLSAPTNKGILDDGVREAVTDACIPIKIYHGHVMDLVGKVDYIFCPRLVSVRKYGDFGTETFCPKFLGLPDMVRLCLEDLPPLIDVRVDLKQGKHATDHACQEVGQILGNNSAQIKAAQKKATRTQKKFESLLNKGLYPEQAMEILFGDKSIADFKVEGTDLNIAVVGYPYAIYDPYLNVSLLDILKKQGVRVYTQDMLSNKQMNKYGRTLPKNLFWYFSNRAVNGALYFLDQPYIDGMIHVTAFACGPDAMVDRLIEIETHKRSSIPYLAVTIDEHTAQTGVQTRVEAFLDMLRYRRDAK